MASVFLFAVIILSSCTKEGPAGSTGAMGPIGASGAAGSDGTDGINGTDGTAGCIECHDSDQRISIKQFQWERSRHARGTALSRASSASCAPCHSQQGFMLSDGNNPLTRDEWVGVNDPVTINCYTCHNIHQTYTPADLGFTYTDQPNWHVTNGEDVSIDFGKANLCVHCHQSRTRSPVVDMTDLTIEYSSISTYFGPHYSAQANLMGGFGAYELEGPKSYPTGNGHLGVTNVCVGCHMGFSSSAQTGGHTWIIDPENDLADACDQCHTGDVAEEYYDGFYAKNFVTVNDHGKSTATLNTTSLFTVLGDLLVLKGVYTKATVLDDNGYMDHQSYNIISGLTLNGTLTAALFNHRFLYQDRSHGIHNPKWTEALLTNSIEAVKAL